jgi:hypothetical protein
MAIKFTKPRRTDGKWSTRLTWSRSSASTPFVNGKLVERSTNAANRKRPKVLHPRASDCSRSR